MVTIGMNYKVLPGKEETFERACNGVIEAMAGIDGHQESFYIEMLMMVNPI